VGIGPDHQIAGPDQTLFRQKAVLDTHGADLKVVGEAVHPGKISQNFGLFGGFDVFIRDKVVRDQGYPLPVEYAGHPDLFKFFNRHRRGDVVAQDQVDPGIDQLTGQHFLLAGMCRQDFFGYGHRHWMSPLFCLFFIGRFQAGFLLSFVNQLIHGASQSLPRW